MIYKLFDKKSSGTNSSGSAVKSEVTLKVSNFANIKFCDFLPFSRNYVPEKSFKTTIPVYRISLL